MSQRCVTHTNERYGYTVLSIWDTDNIIHAQNEIIDLIENKLHGT
jgi:hypothetical protein